MAGKGTLQFDATVSADQINSLLRSLRTEAEGAAKSINDAFGGTVSKKIVLETVTDENGVRKLVAVEKERLSVTDQIIAAQKKLDNIQQGSLTSLRQQVNQAKQVRDELARFKTVTDQYGKSVRQTNTEWAVANQRVSQIQRQLDLASASGFWDRVKTSLNVQGLVNFSNGLNQVVQGFQAASIAVGSVSSSINSFVTALADLQSFGLAFKAIGAGAVGGAVALQESSRIALGLGVNLGTVRQGFQQLTPVVLNSGGTIEDVSKIVNALSSRFAAFSISGDRARRVTNGVIQAFAKGKLQAEELTQQISEADPAFKTDFANAIGVSVAELEKLVKAGQITSDVLIKAIPQLDKTALLYGKLGNSAVEAVAGLEQGNTTIDQVRNKLQALGQLSFERLAKAIEPVLLVFLKGQAIITDFFDRISRLDVIKSLGNTAAGLGNALLALIDAFLRIGEAALNVINIIDKLSLGLAIPGAIALKLIGILSSFGDAMNDGAAKTSLLGRAASGLASPLENLNSAFGAVFLGATKTQKEIKGFQDRQAALGSTSAKVASRIEALKGRIDEYQKAITKTRTSGLTTIGGAQAQQQITQYEDKIKSLQNNLAKYEVIQGSLTDKQAQAGAAADALAKRKGFLAGATTRLTSAWKAATGGVQALLSFLGPVGIALAALAVIQAGNNTIYEEANRIKTESKDRLDNLKQATEALGGATQASTQPLTGFALAWANIALLITNATDALRKFLDQAIALIPGTVPGVGKVEQAFQRAAVVIGAFFGGALAGGALSAGNPVVAALAGLTAAVAAFAATGDDAEVKAKQLVSSVEAVGNAVKQESVAFAQLIGALYETSIGINNTKKAQQELQAELAKEQKLPGGGDQEKIKQLTEQIAQNQSKINSETQKFNSSYVAGRNALEALVREQQKLEGLVKGTKEQQSQITGGDNKRKKAVEDILKLEQDLKKLREQQQAAGGGQRAFGDPPVDPKELEEINKKIAETIKRIEALREVSGTSPETEAEYQRLQALLKQLDPTYQTVTEQIKRNTAALDAAAISQGLLTSEQKKTVSTIGSLSAAIKTNQDLLENDLNPNVTKSKWIETNELIAQQGIELQDLKDRAESLQAFFSAAELKLKVDSGEVLNSIENANRLVQFLEKAIVTIDFNSPKLPGLIADLINAEQRVDQIDGKRAQITLELIQKGIKEGTIDNNLKNLDRQISALEATKVTIPITSGAIDPVIQEINTLSLRKDLGAKSSAELQRLLDTENANERKRLLDEQTNAEKAAISERKQALQDELTQVKEIAAARIEALRELTPAEQALARFREEELRKQASSGEDKGERLAAQAQLERLEREKQIAQISKEAKRQEAELQRKIAEEEKKEKELEKKAREENLEIQRELLRIAQEEKKERLAIAQAILDARKNSKETGQPQKEGGEPAVAGTTGDALADIQLSEVAAEGLRENLEEAGPALNEAVEPADQIATALTTAAEQASNIQNAIESLDGLTVRVRVIGIPARWAGGPTTAGQTYQVNELGQEGFLSAGGRLTPINKPKNALWRAPSSGTVIPAHIWSRLDVPSGGVSTTARPVTSGFNSGGLQKIARAIQSSLRQPDGASSAIQELSAVQAHQSMAIGKLSRAVDKLANKDQKVEVSIRNNNSNAYLEAFSRTL